MPKLLIEPLPQQSAPATGNADATNEELLEMVGTMDITPSKTLPDEKVKVRKNQKIVLCRTKGDSRVLSRS